MLRVESRNRFPTSSSTTAAASSLAPPTPARAAPTTGTSLSRPSAIHSGERGDWKKGEGGACRDVSSKGGPEIGPEIGMTALSEPSRGSSTPCGAGPASSSGSSEMDEERRCRAGGSSGIVWLPPPAFFSGGASEIGSSIVLRQTSTTVSPSAGMGAPQFRQNRAKSRADLPHRRQFIAHSNARRRIKPTIPSILPRNLPSFVPSSTNSGIPGSFGWMALAFRTKRREGGRWTTSVCCSTTNI